jgi:anaerobic ribonucleoside-triphosphate reductase activating protein
MATLRINRLHWPVTTLGYGKRIGIWLQGCSIRCPGCCSQDTWEANAGSEISLEVLLEWIACHPTDEIEGFTITGGEPFEQPTALAALLKQLKTTYCQSGQRDILVYSGYPMHQLKRRHQDILELIDMLVSEPYLNARPIALLRGSNNQNLNRMTGLSRARYPETTSPDPTNRLQIQFDGTALWMIGIPNKDDLSRLQQQLAAKGITMNDVSWMA